MFEGKLPKRYSFTECGIINGHILPNSWPPAKDEDWGPVPTLNCDNFTSFQACDEGIMQLG